MRLLSKMRSTLILALLPLALSQSILPASLPSCATQCTTLQNAATGCLPSGGAPVSNAATYQNCFCQSGLLTGMSDANTICPNVCDDADWNTINTWRVEYCGTPVQAAAGSASTSSAQGAQGAQQTTLATQASISEPTSTAGTITGSGSGSGSGVGVGVGGTDSNTGSTTTYASGSAWFATHWNWVVMVIVLAVLLSAIGIVAGVWHRKYTKKRDSAGAGPAMSRWAPPIGGSHNVQSLGGNYGVGGVDEKGKATVTEARV